MDKANTTEKEISSKQKLIFRLITALIPVIILLAFEGILRLANYGDNLNLFVKNPLEGYEEYMMVNPKVGKKYFQKFEYTNPPNDIFLIKKPENTFRIFVLGSSTVFGFPYERNLMFSRIIHQQLEEAYPGKKIEMVNTSITAINSFTLHDFTRQVLKHQPDAILIYAGHNEFYGAFGIGSNETMSKNIGLTRLHIRLMDVRVYQLLRNMISGVAGAVAGDGNQVKGTLMKRMVADKDILYDSEEYRIAMDSYQKNMEDILKAISKKNVPVFFSEVVSNINGMQPFNSIKTENLEGAAEVYTKAVEAEKNGDFEKAFQLYYRAKDLDCIRFRASEEVNRIIDELAEKYKVHKVPMLSWFQENAPNKLIGNNLMTEHVHPNIDGCFLMAEGFYREILNSKILGEENRDPGYSLVYKKRNWGYTAVDSLVGEQRVMLLKGFWPFVLDEKNEVDYKKVYRPKSLPDSLVFSVLLNPKTNLSMARLELAEKYKNEGKHFLAFKEYDALLRSNPYIALNYRDAATSLTNMSDLPLALKYYRKSLDLDESGFAWFKMGEIYLFMGDYKNAIKSFERSFPLVENDRKVVVLGKAFAASVFDNDREKAEAIANELKKAKAENYLRIPRKTYLFNDFVPLQTRNQVETAKMLLGENKNDEALELLKSSLEIYDSHIANRMIGEIYLKQRNLDMALIHFLKVYDLFRFHDEFLNNMILIYLNKKDMANARKCFDQLKLVDPRSEYVRNLNLLLSPNN